MVGGLLAYDARDRGGEEEEEEERASGLSIFSHCLVYLPVSFRRAIFPCVVISLPPFSLSFFLFLGSLVVR